MVEEPGATADHKGAPLEDAVDEGDSGVLCGAVVVGVDGDTDSKEAGVDEAAEAEAEGNPAGEADGGAVAGWGADCDGAVAVEAVAVWLVDAAAKDAAEAADGEVLHAGVEAVEAEALADSVAVRDGAAVRVGVDRALRVRLRAAVDEAVAMAL